MGVFEEHPWLLVVVIIVTVEAWQALRGLVRSRLARTPTVTERDRQRF